MAIAIVFSIFLVALCFVVFGLIFHYAGTEIEHKTYNSILIEQNDKLFYNLMNKDVIYEGNTIKISDLVRISTRNKNYNLLKKEIDKHFVEFKWYFALSMREREINSFKNIEDFDGVGVSEYVLADETDIKIKFLVKI